MIYFVSLYSGARHFLGPYSVLREEKDEKDRGSTLLSTDNPGPEPCSGFYDNSYYITYTQKNMQLFPPDANGLAVYNVMLDDPHLTISKSEIT